MQRRESIVRALSDGGQCSTWNVMIDLVAQSGRLFPGAGSLADFGVEGQKHYWVHLAIDRFTGQVIDAKWEAGYE